MTEERLKLAGARSLKGFYVGMGVIFALGVGGWFAWPTIHLEYSYRQWRSDPASQNTELLLQHGDRAARLLERNVQAEVQVSTKASAVIRGRLLQGAPAGHLRLGAPQGDGLIMDIALGDIKWIVPIHTDSGPQTRP